MRKLSEFQDEEALDLLADILPPVSAIAADKSVQGAFKSGTSLAEIVKLLIKAHKGEVMQIMASLEGVSVEDFHCNLLTLPMMLLQILNDEDLKSFFTSAVQNMPNDSFGSVTATTEDGEESALS